MKRVMTTLRRCPFRIQTHPEPESHMSSTHKVIYGSLKREHLLRQRRWQAR
jgi:hypothetical protein